MELLQLARKQNIFENCKQKKMSKEATKNIFARNVDKKFAVRTRGNLEMCQASVAKLLDVKHNILHERHKRRVGLAGSW